MNKKELYRFNVKIKEEEIPVVFLKPDVDQQELAAHFFSQRFNEYVGEGFMTRAMMYKKLGDTNTKEQTDAIAKALQHHMEASRIIEFLNSSPKKLTKAQKTKLTNAEEDFAESRKALVDYESHTRNQFAHTADKKAEDKLVEWYLFNCSFYEEKLGEKTSLFPVFKGDDFDAKRRLYLTMADEDFESEDENLIKNKELFAASFEKLVTVISLFINGLAKNKEEMEKQLSELESSSG